MISEIPRVPNSLMNKDTLERSWIESIIRRIVYPPW
jgi:hypothetical protein